MKFSPLEEVSEEMEEAIKQSALQVSAPPEYTQDLPAESPPVLTDPPATAAPASAGLIVPENSLININSASSGRLDDLPGIGPSKAKAIVEYREKNGSFQSIQQLMDVKGIGPKIFEGMKDLISVK